MNERSVLVRLGLQATGYVQGMEKVTKTTREAGSEAEKLAQKREAFDTLGQSAVGFGVAMLAATGYAVKAAIDWESAWTGVTKTVDGSAATLERLEGDLRGLTRTLPSSHAEIAAVAEAAGQLGVKAENVAAFTKVMIDLGETTNLSSDEAATSLAQLMNVMQTAPEDVGRLGAAVVALGNDGASTERDIVQMAQRIAGAGKVIGLTEGEVLGFANALASAGIEVEAGGSAISTIMIDIAQAVSSGGSKLNTFARTAGMSAEEFSRAFKDTPAEAISSFVNGLGRLNESGGDVFATLSSLGQSDVRVTRALLGMATSGDLLAKSLALGNSAWEDNTALLTEAEKRYGTTEAQMQMLGNRVNDAAIDFGQVFLPALTAVAGAIGDFADGLADLDPFLQSLIAGGGALIGVIALVGGAALLAVPKLAAFKLGLIELNLVGAASNGVLQKLGAFLLGPWGIAVAAAVAGLVILNQWMESTRASSAELTAVTSQTAASAQDVFDTFTQGGGIWVADLNKDLQRTIDLMGANPDAWTTFWADLGIQQTRGTLVKIGEELSALATTDLPTAQQAFRKFSDETDGTAKSQIALLAAMPKYREALVAQATAMGTYSVNNSEAANNTALLELALGSAKPAIDDTKVAVDLLATATVGSSEVLAEWIKLTAEADSKFVNMKSGYDLLVKGSIDAATATAESTASSTDSWEDYYDGFSVNVDKYLADLQRQVDAQTNWESNMILLSGRVSKGVLDELRSMGPEGAGLVASLVNGTDEQLAQMEGLFAERSGAATDAFANTLGTAGPVIAAAAAQLGQDAAKEIAGKLAAGTHTVADIMREYGLTVEGVKPRVRVNTSGAEEDLRRFVQRWTGATINLRATGSAKLGSGVLNNYQGAIYRQGVKAFAAGGFASGIYAGVEGGIHKFAEKDMGVPWETYISGRPSDRERNLGLWATTGRMLGAYQSGPTTSAPTIVNINVPVQISTLAADNPDMFARHVTTSVKNGLRDGTIPKDWNNV